MAAPMTSFAGTGAVTYARLIMLFFTFFAAFCEGERTLRLVHVLYRHGDRSPVPNYPNDNYTEDTWPQGFGQLTEHGMMQHYELGQWLRKRYITSKTFLNSKYKRTEMKVVSTDYDRTIMSADSNLQGLYPTQSDKGLLWKPIPVFRLPKECDPYLYEDLKSDKCPRLQQLMEPVIQAKSEYIMKRKDLFQGIAEKAGYSTLNFDNMTRLADSFHFEALDGRKLPDWATDEVLQRLTELHHFSYRAVFNNKSEEYRKLIGGNFLKQIVGHITNYTSGANNQSKLFMYSGHDTTVAILLSTLGIPVPGTPNTASCILVELYEEDDRTYTVDVYFRNNTNLLQELVIPGCSVHCPLEKFYSLTESLIPRDFKAECKKHIDVQWVEWNNTGWLMMFIILVSAIILALVMISLACASSHRRKSLLRERRMEPINFHLLGHHGSDSEEDESVFDT